jgi:hypothetical protein
LVIDLVLLVGDVEAPLQRRKIYIATPDARADKLSPIASYR